MGKNFGAVSYDFEMKFDLGASGNLIFFFFLMILGLSVWLGNLETEDVWFIFCLQFWVLLLIFYMFVHLLLMFVMILLISFVF
jgi:hypothetical protein